MSSTNKKIEILVLPSEPILEESYEEALLEIAKLKKEKDALEEKQRKSDGKMKYLMSMLSKMMKKKRQHSAMEQKL